MLFRSSKDAEAAAQWAEVVRERPDDDAARLRLADLYLGLEQQDSALELYKAILVHRPDDPSLRRRTGTLLMDMDRGPEAIPHLEAYIALLPGDEEALRALEKLYAWNERPEDARRLLEKRVETHPDDLDASTELAERCVDAGQEAKAITLYDRIVKARPDDLGARRALAELYEWNAAPGKALQQYEAILDARPFDAEVRSRALSLSSDLGLGSKARQHAYLLRSNDPRYKDLSRQTLLVDTGFGTWAGVQYTFFHEKDRVYFHGVGPKAAYQVRDGATIGAWYQFRHLTSPSSLANSPKRTVMGHAVGVFTELVLPAEFRLSAGASYIHYDTGFDSGNGFLTLSRDFDRVTLTFEAERVDLLGSVGDVERKIVANNLVLSLDAEPVDRFLLHLSGGGGFYSDWNRMANAAASIGWRPLDSPRLELWYEYTYLHAAYTEAKYPRITYFAPDHYHSHGPLITWSHAAATWFAYGLDLHLWHVYGAADNALLLQYTPKVTFRPALHHLLQASYTRTDTLWGSIATRYQDNLLLFTYAYEF